MYILWLLVLVLVAAIIAYVVDIVLNALIVFPHSTLIIGLFCAVLFLVIVFGGWGRVPRSGPPAV